MILTLKRLLRKINLFKKTYVKCNGSILPSPDRRWCGPEFRNNSYYLRSAESEALRLINKLGCNKQSKILDIGCGQGRLPIGLTRIMGEIDYIGIDVDQWSVRWCKRFISKYHPAYHFFHINVGNERYNNHGDPLNSSFRFDFPDNNFDIIYLYSVFSHMKQEDMLIYLTDTKRILKAKGQVFFTTFIEENVENVSYDSPDYGFIQDRPLHSVRYEKKYLFSLLVSLGFEVREFNHKAETDGQSAVYITISSKENAHETGRF